MIIGELTTVPQPGMPVASPWAQEVSHRVVHVFASKALLDAWTTAQLGTYADAAGIFYRKIAAGWARLTPLTMAVTGAGLTNSTAQTIAEMTIPADPGPRFATVSFHCLVNVGGSSSGDIQLRLDAVSQQLWRLVAGNTIMVSLVAAFLPLAAGVAHNLSADWAPAGGTTPTLTTFADPTFNSLRAAVHPTI
jgi:hypothetical protein